MSKTLICPLLSGFKHSNKAGSPAVLVCLKCPLPVCFYDLPTAGKNLQAFTFLCAEYGLVCDIPACQSVRGKTMPRCGYCNRNNELGHCTCFFGVHDSRNRACSEWQPIYKLPSGKTQPKGVSVHRFVSLTL